MPYRSNRELPDNVRSVLPENAQAIWRNVFNSVESKGRSETSAIQQAWGAVKNAGYDKVEGKWKKVNKSLSAPLELLGEVSIEVIEKFLSSEEGAQVIEDLIEYSSVNITKIDEEQRLVFGFFSINKIDGELVEDLQGDYIPTESLEKAAYDFVLNARIAGERHIRKGVGRLVESIVFTEEKQKAIGECLRKQGISASINLGCEGWFGGFKIDNEEVWKMVVSGEYPAFSIGGKGKRISMDEEGDE
jgi:cation transport regulator ChaB